MITGLMSGIFWGLDTVILGIALSMPVFNEGSAIIYFAPFISTFWHDLSSSFWLTIYMILKKQYKLFFYAVKSKAGKYIIFAAIFGGPIGMSCYLIAIKNIGPGYTAVISSMYPALGAFLAHIFLKEKMNLVQIVGLILATVGVIALGYSGQNYIYSDFTIGFISAILCCLGWASEAVICAYGMKEPEVGNEQALQIRQFTSSIVYLFIIVFLVKNTELTFKMFNTIELKYIFVAAFFGTISYLFYYKAIIKLGASKAMPLNITYSSWAIIFSMFLLNIIPDLKTIFCGVVIIIGSLLAATDIYKIFGIKS